MTTPKSFTDADSQSGWNTGARAWETFVHRLPYFVIFDVVKHGR